jgi:hypothetical protein
VATNIRLAWIILGANNTLAYFPSKLATKKKVLSAWR